MTLYFLQAGINDFGLLKSAVEKNIGISNTILLITIGANILTLVVNIWLQLKIKNRDKKIHKYKIREEKRIEITEELYKKLNDINDIDPINQVTLLEQIASVNTYINSNNLYIEDKVKDISNRYLDFFRQIAATPYKRDLKKTFQLLNEFKTEFNKL